MNCFKTIIELQDILFPKFYTAIDSEDNEYIFLKTQDSMINSLDKVSDKTQLEAYENHIHILRFHQLWENEEPYYDVKDFPNIEVFKI